MLGCWPALDLWFCKRALPKHPFEQLRNQLAISRSTAMWNELA
jgi:hypothetical protein